MIAMMTSLVDAYSGLLFMEAVGIYAIEKVEGVEGVPFWMMFILNTVRVMNVVWVHKVHPLEYWY